MRRWLGCSRPSSYLNHGLRPPRALAGVGASGVGGRFGGMKSPAKVGRTKRALGPDNLGVLPLSLESDVQLRLEGAGLLLEFDAQRQANKLARLGAAGAKARMGGGVCDLYAISKTLDEGQAKVFFSKLALCDPRDPHSNARLIARPFSMGGLQGPSGQVAPVAGQVGLG